MNKKIIFTLIFVIAFTIFLYFLFLKNINSGEDKIKMVCIGERCFDVEVAITEEERTKGLMLRDNLEEDKGMLFIFENEGIYGFWMKDTIIPLKIIWINENKDVVYIVDTIPCKNEICEVYSSDEKAKYVLEINSSIWGIKIGDKIVFI